MGRDSSKSGVYYYLILREHDRQRTFNIIVSPATYSQTKIGAIKTYKLQDSRVNQSKRENVIHGLFAVFCIIVSVIGGMSFVFWLFAQWNKEEQDD